MDVSKHGPPPLKRVAVDSEALAEVGYDRRLGFLDILFANGRLYRYVGVPPGVYRLLMQASSMGAFFNEGIRDHYPQHQLA